MRCPTSAPIGPRPRGGRTPTPRDQRLTDRHRAHRQCTLRPYRSSLCPACRSSHLLRCPFSLSLSRPFAQERPFEFEWPSVKNGSRRVGRSVERHQTDDGRSTTRNQARSPSLTCRARPRTGGETTRIREESMYCYRQLDREIFGGSLLPN